MSRIYLLTLFTTLIHKIRFASPFITLFHDATLFFVSVGGCHSWRFQLSSNSLSIMTYKGIVRGKTIELEEQLPYPEGQPVSVSVELLQAKPQLDLRTVIRQIMHEPPHLSWEDVDELERAIEQGKLPVYQGSVFD